MMVKEIYGDFYKGKRVLATGHTGFKGSWLTEWLLMMGAKVTGLALPPNTQPALFEQLGLESRCDHRIGDIRDRELVRRIIHEVRPDIIFHLAAQPLVRLSYAQPLETYETNVMGTAHVLDALRDADWPCSAVMITTDKVYENQEQGRAYQETDPLGGYDPYSSSKACAELVIQSYRNSFFNPDRIQKISEQIPPLVAVASARAGNVIGGGDWAQDRIVPDCIRALAKGEPIMVRNPNAVRPWQHVLEPLSGYLLLGMRIYEALCDPRAEVRSPRSEARSPESEVRNPKSEVRGSPSDLRSPPSDPGPRKADLVSLCSAFNFGPVAGSNRSVRELVEAVLKNWPGTWTDGSDPRAPHEAELLSLATARARAVLGWEPRWDFGETVAATVEGYRGLQRGGLGSAVDVVGRQINAYMGCRA